MKTLTKIDEIAEKTIFSGVISIKKNNKIIYEKSFGYADRSNKRANNVNTRFGIASGTKIFTALAIGKLIDSGKISLNSKAFDLVNYNFNKVFYSQDVTIKQLLTHTSGIPDYLDEDLIEDFDNFNLGVPWYEIREPKDYFPFFPQREMKFSPGEKFSYSNGGFVLLAAIIAETSGMRYSEYVQKEVFNVCNMDSSGYYAFNQLPANTANGYIDEDNSWRTNIYNLPIIGGGDGGAYTNAADMYQMWECLYNYEILSKELTNKYLTSVVISSKKDNNCRYGYGIWRYHENDSTVTDFITGADAGVSFQSQCNKSRNLAYTVLSNTSEGAWKIIDTINNLKL